MSEAAAAVAAAAEEERDATGDQEALADPRHFVELTHLPPFQAASLQFPDRQAGPEATQLSAGQPSQAETAEPQKLSWHQPRFSKLSLAIQQLPESNPCVEPSPYPDHP